MPLAIESALGELGPRVKARGPLDITTADALEQALLAAEDTGPEVLELDVREIEFFDSTGLQIILDAHLRLSQRGRTLVVVAGDGEVRRVLDLAEVSSDLELR